MRLLPECDMTNTLLYEVVVELIGLWSEKTEHFVGEFYTSTYIDTAINLVSLYTLTPNQVMSLLENFIKLG